MNPINSLAREVQDGIYQTINQYQDFGWNTIAALVKRQFGVTVTGQQCYQFFLHRFAG